MGGRLGGIRGPSIPTVKSITEEPAIATPAALFVGGTKTVIKTAAPKLIPYIIGAAGGAGAVALLGGLGGGGQEQKQKQAAVAEVTQQPVVTPRQDVATTKLQRLQQELIARQQAAITSALISRQQADIEAGRDVTYYTITHAQPQVGQVAAAIQKPEQMESQIFS